MKQSADNPQAVTPRQPKAKYTPGPWRVDHHFYCHSHVLSGDKILFQTQCENSGVSEESKANVHLIAAAPELLQALNKAIAYLVNPQAFDSVELGKDWLRLKTKAEGK